MRRAVILFVVLTLALSFTITGSFAERTGKQLYESMCVACHGSGVLNAPKFGTSDWVELARKGIDGLTERAMEGFGAMHPKGGCGDCSEAEIRAAIHFMLDSAK